MRPNTQIPDLSKVDILNEVSAWKVDAANDDIERYFYEFPGFEKILRGEYPVVVGRKGTGKSAIASHINQIKDDYVFSSVLNISALAFRDFSRSLEQKGLSVGSHTLAWKYLIYSSMLDQMSLQEGLAPEAEKVLLDRRPSGPEHRLRQTLTRYASSSFGGGLSLLGYGGVNVQTSRGAVEKPTIGLQEVVEIMEDFILTYALDSTRHYIIIDDLDLEDPRALSIDSEEWKFFQSSVSGLFRACIEVRSEFRRQRIQLIPIALVRDDIFEIAENSNKAKWVDSTFELSWRIEDICRMLAYRITRAFSLDLAPLPFDRAWKVLFFPHQTLRVTQKHRIDESSPPFREFNILEYIQQRTLQRPRDFIRYLAICSEVTKRISLDLTRIPPSTVVNSEYEYSKWFLQELDDEVRLQIEDFKDIVRLLDGTLLEYNFSFEALKMRLEEKVVSGELTQPSQSVAEILRILFNYSAIANAYRRPKPLNGSKWYRPFKYARPTAILDLKEDLCLHSGIFPAACPKKHELYGNISLGDFIHESDATE